MISPKYRKHSLLTIRIILGLVFLLSGVGKLIDSGYVNYDLVRLLSSTYFWIIEYAAHLIITLSIVELLIVALLLWGKYLKWTLTAALLMLSGFTGILGYFYFQGMNVANCGCFGAFGFASGLEFTLIRNGVLILLIIAGFMLLYNENKLRAEPAETAVTQ
jgi:uncharacterized membrane protein YphA (DoxX/SURF4 family)